MTGIEVPFFTGVTLLKFLAVAGLFGFSPKGLNEAAGNISFDKEDAVQKLNSGLEWLSNADARSTGEANQTGVSKDISVGDAETARRIADALSAPKRGWFG